MWTDDVTVPGVLPNAASLQKNGRTALAPVPSGALLKFRTDSLLICLVGGNGPRLLFSMPIVNLTHGVSGVVRLIEQGLGLPHLCPPGKQRTKARHATRVAEAGRSLEQSRRGSLIAALVGAHARTYEAPDVRLGRRRGTLGLVPGRRNRAVPAPPDRYKRCRGRRQSHVVPPATSSALEGDRRLSKRGRDPSDAVVRERQQQRLHTHGTADRQDKREDHGSGDG
jgi:hypothetical protein